MFKIETFNWFWFNFCLKLKSMVKNNLMSYKLTDN